MLGFLAIGPANAAVAENLGTTMAKCLAPPATVERILSFPRAPRGVPVNTSPEIKYNKHGTRFTNLKNA